MSSSSTPLILPNLQRRPLSARCLGILALALAPALAAALAPAALRLVAAPAAATAAEAALAAAPAVAVAARGAGRGLLRQGLREHLGREVELLVKELDPLVRQEVVVPPPVVDLRAVRPRGQATEQHVRVEVGHVHLLVLRLVRGVLDAHHAFVEEVRVDLTAVLLRDEHHRGTMWPIGLLEP